MVFENGKAEGSFAQYMEHHLGPELGEITEFTFHKSDGECPDGRPCSVRP